MIETGCRRLASGLQNLGDDRAKRELPRVAKGNQIQKANEVPKSQTEIPTRVPGVHANLAWSVPDYKVAGTANFLAGFVTLPVV